MSTRSLSRRLDRLARRMPTPTALAATTTVDAEAEARVYAVELQRAYAAVLLARRREAAASAEDAQRWADGRADGVYREQILHGPPQQMTWFGLDRLALEDPARSVERWAEVRQAAQDEVATGFRAARTAGAVRQGPWPTAQFLAARQAVLLDGRFHTGADALLADVAADAYGRYLDAVARASQLHACEDEPQTAARAADLREVMAEALHWHGVLVQTLRVLRDLRGVGSPVRIGQALQVNVGGQQINVAEDPT